MDKFPDCLMDINLINIAMKFIKTNHLTEMLMKILMHDQDPIIIFNQFLKKNSDC